MAFDARQSDVCVYGNRAAPLDTDGYTQAIVTGAAGMVDSMCRFAESVRDDVPDVFAYGGGNQSGPIDVSTACNASERWDFESEPFVTHTLRADGFDANEDGTGRELAPVGIQAKGTNVGSGLPTLRAASGGSAGAGCPAVLTLAIRGRGDSHDLECRDDGIANAVLTPGGSRGGIGVRAVAFAQNTRDEVREMPYAGALAAEPGMKQTSYIRQAMSVRRLTPKECARLQGFPDPYLDIVYRNKPAADGNKYKALGNSMCVPVITWLGKRIQLVEDTISGLAVEDAAE